MDKPKNDPEFADAFVAPHNPVPALERRIADLENGLVEVWSVLDKHSEQLLEIESVIGASGVTPPRTGNS